MKIFPPLRITIDDAIDRFKTLYRYKTELNDYPEVRDRLIEVSTTWISDRLKALNMHIVGLPKEGHPLFAKLLRKLIDDGVLVEFPTLYLPEPAECSLAAVIPNNETLGFWKECADTLSLCIAAGEQSLDPETVLRETLKT